MFYSECPKCKENSFEMRQANDIEWGDCLNCSYSYEVDFGEDEKE